MISEISSLRNRAGLDVAAVALPGYVEASWQRCLESYNLQPDVMRSVDMLSYHELQSRLERHEVIAHFARTEIERLFQRLVDNEYMVSLASPEGVMLMFRCDHVFLGEMSTFGVLPGSNWSEEVQGTNGIGTCLKTGKPLSITGDQHFNVHVRNLSCSVAPILGQDGMIEGVVNVTSSRPVNDKTARLVLDIVERSARRIENRYFAHRNRHFRTLCLSCEQDFTDMADETRVAIDDQGRIVDVSQKAPALFGRSRDALLGTDIGSLMVSSGSMEQVESRDVELLGHNGRTVYATLLSGGDGVRVPQRRSRASSRAVQASPLSEPLPVETWLPHKHMFEKIALAERMLSAHVPILLQGETGVGKSTFAALVSRRYGQGKSDVVILNCAVLTGEEEALDRLRGQLSQFTLILDHIEEASPAAQTCLLQLLSDDHALRSRDIGLISIASRNLAELAQEGRLRLDLYHRLKGIVIDLPPIRVTPDIEKHIRTVFTAEARECGKPDPRLDDLAVLTLAHYHWPGNWRELRHAARHAVILAEGDQIGIGHLPEHITSQIAHENISARSQSEAARIQAALRYNGGNVSETARYLGISRATLYRKVQIRNIRPDDGSRS